MSRNLEGVVRWVPALVQSSVGLFCNRYDIERVSAKSEIRARNLKTRLMFVTVTKETRCSARKRQRRNLSINPRLGTRSCHSGLGVQHIERDTRSITGCNVSLDVLP